MAASAVRKQLTLLLLHAGDSVLLGMKKRGFGATKFNGFGGKVEPGETLVAGAVREMVEESGVTPLDPALCGHILFKFEGQAEELEVHVFRATRSSGEPVETDEMRPQWFKVADIPYDRMWLDDRHWLPLLLAGKSFDAEFLFRGQEEILSMDITEVTTMPVDASAVLVAEAQTAISIV